MEIVNGLPKGALIHGKLSDYEITGYRSQDGFGILYEAEVVTQGNKKGKNNDMRVVMREFFMQRCSRRDEDGCTVYTPEELTPTVNSFYKAFVFASNRCAQATTYSGAGVVNVIEVVNQNGTSYYVVEYLEGETLEDYINAHGPLTVHEAISIFKPILEGVRHLHSFQMMHADIYPRHIRFTKSGGRMIAVLFSLYASKHFDDSGNPVITTPILVCRKGYSPPEQYNVVENFMPQLDIYALAAVLVFVLSGKNLPDSRVLTEKDIRATLPATLPETLVSTLIHALQPEYRNRPTNISSFMDELMEYFEINDRYSPIDERKHSLHSKKESEVYRKNESHNLLTSLISLFRKEKK